jgi:hypothetical protein
LDLVTKYYLEVGTETMNTAKVIETAKQHLIDEEYDLHPVVASVTSEVDDEESITIEFKSGWVVVLHEAELNPGRWFVWTCSKPNYRS